MWSIVRRFALAWLLLVASVPTYAQQLSIQVSPSNPTTKDFVAVRLFGDWPTGCVPDNPQVAITGNQIRIATFNPNSACLTQVTPWEIGTTLGQLAAGNYQVSVAHNGQATGSATFTVVTAPQFPTRLTGSFTIKKETRTGDPARRYGTTRTASSLLTFSNLELEWGSPNGGYKRYYVTKGEWRYSSTYLEQQVSDRCTVIIRSSASGFGKPPEGTLETISSSGFYFSIYTGTPVDGKRVEENQCTGTVEEKKYQTWPGYADYFDWSRMRKENGRVVFDLNARWQESEVDGYTTWELTGQLAEELRIPHPTDFNILRIVPNPLPVPLPTPWLDWASLNPYDVLFVYVWNSSTSNRDDLFDVQFREVLVYATPTEVRVTETLPSDFEIPYLRGLIVQQGLKVGDNWVLPVGFDPKKGSAPPSPSLPGNRRINPHFPVLWKGNAPLGADRHWCTAADPPFGNFTRSTYTTEQWYEWTSDRLNYWINGEIHANPPRPNPFPEASYDSASGTWWLRVESPLAHTIIKRTITIIPDLATGARTGYYLIEKYGVPYGPYYLGASLP